MEALTTIARRRALLAREIQEGLTLGVDSGSSTTKAVIMQDNRIIGTGWLPTTAVLKSAEDAIDLAIKEAGIRREEIQAIGTTGYGRFLVGDKIRADLIQEELTVNSKGAVYLADTQHGPSTVIDIGGMDNNYQCPGRNTGNIHDGGHLCRGKWKVPRDDRKTTRN